MKLFVKNTNGVQSMSYQRYLYCLYVFSLMFCITIYQLCTYTKMLNYAWKLLFMVPAIININRPNWKNIFKATNKRTRTFF